METTPKQRGLQVLWVMFISSAFLSINMFICSIVYPDLVHKYWEGNRFHTAIEFLPMFFGGILMCLGSGIALCILYVITTKLIDYIIGVNDTNFLDRAVNKFFKLPLQPKKRKLQIDRSDPDFRTGEREVEIALSEDKYENLKRNRR